MKTCLVFQKSLFIAFMLLISAFTFNSCTKEELIENQSIQNDKQIETRAASEFHWRCPSCGNLNAGWRESCLSCSKSYSPIHGDLVLSILDVISRNVSISGGVVGREGNDRLIQLPQNFFPDRAPEPWYESGVALNYYDRLKTMNYYALPEYAEGVDFGWYRTVRTLYPKITDVLQAKNQYDKWLVGAGRGLKGNNGTGIKDGSKAAVDAFAAYR